MPFLPMQTSATTYWAPPTPGFNVPSSAIVEPTSFTRAILSASGLGATTDGELNPFISAAQKMSSTATTASVVGMLAGIAVRSGMGYFIGKWANASPGWTAAGAGMFGTLGILVSVGATGKSKAQGRVGSVAKNPRKGKCRAGKGRCRTLAQTWDILWENHIAARRSGNEQRMLDTAELLEDFDRSHGWKPTVTVAQVRREIGA
jgi:hypothetical protein